MTQPGMMSLRGNHRHSTHACGRDAVPVPVPQAGAQRAAAALGVALIAPDTSPRGLNVEGEAESWDFGVGAGFYLNATVDKWKNYRMYDYVVSELPDLLSAEFPQLDTANASIMGHSMGGHGALTIALKNPTKYKARQGGGLSVGKVVGK